jgi:hypothetical protein
MGLIMGERYGTVAGHQGVMSSSISNQAAPQVLGMRQR